MGNTEMTLSGRSMEEITASVKIHMQDMVTSTLALGWDLIDAKEACGHGRWLPWLKSVGISSSTAANYIRIAKEVGQDSKMANLPYTKVLALLSLPPEERESAAEAAENMSAAEIRRLTEERNRAAEAANSETARADAADAEAKRFFDEAAHERTRADQAEAKLEKFDLANQELRQQRDDLYRKINTIRKEGEERENELKAKLLIAENNRVEVEVEKVPDDYERIKAELAAAKKNAKELVEAAAEAEERANAAEAELDEMRSANSQNKNSEYDKLHYAMEVFFVQCEMMIVMPERFITDMDKTMRDLKRIQTWSTEMQKALERCTVPAEGEAMVI